MARQIAGRTRTRKPPQARPYYQNPGQRTPGAGGMHHGRTGEVDEAQPLQPALATVIAPPDPAAQHRIDQAGNERCTDQIASKTGALGHGTAGDGGGSGGEHELKQQEAVIERCHVLGHEDAGSEQAALVAAKHQAIADHPEHQRTDAQIQHILHDDVDCILGAGHAAFQKGKAGLHQKHQRRSSHQPHGIGAGLALRLGQGGGRQQQQQYYAKVLGSVHGRSIG